MGSDAHGRSYAIPLVAFSFYGVESIAVTASEAERSTSLKYPSRFIPYVVFALYLMCTIGEALTAPWTAPFLPPIFGVNGTNSTTPTRSSNWVVNVALTSGYTKLAGFLNGCFIFSVLSTSNTAMYISSRTLYGMAREVPVTSWLGRSIHRLSFVVRKTGVPAPALLVSALSFVWLPFLQLKSGYALEDVRFISGVASADRLANRNRGLLRKHCLSDCLGCNMLGIHPL